MANGFRVDIVVSAEFLEKWEHMMAEIKAQEEQVSVANKEYDPVKDMETNGLKHYGKKQIVRKDKSKK